MTTRIGDVALKLFEMSDWLEIDGLRIEGTQETIRVPLPLEAFVALPEPTGRFRIVIEVADGMPSTDLDQD